MKDYAEKNGGEALAGGWDNNALQQGKLISPGQQILKVHGDRLFIGEGAVNVFIDVKHGCLFQWEANILD